MWAPIPAIIAQAGPGVAARPAIMRHCTAARTGQRSAVWRTVPRHTCPGLAQAVRQLPGPNGARASVLDAQRRTDPRVPCSAFRPARRARCHPPFWTGQCRARPGDESRAQTGVRRPAGRRGRYWTVCLWAAAHPPVPASTGSVYPAHERVFCHLPGPQSS